MSYTKNIGYIGSISLLLTSITGPGIVAIPAVFQSAGWLIPTLAFIIIGILTGFSCLFVLEACSIFPGNDRFQRNIEFTVLVHQFYGRNWYYVMIFILYGSLQSTNVASIIGCAQVFDNILIRITGVTCGYEIAPANGFICVNSPGSGNSPFGDNFMLGTFGYLITGLFIVPLTRVNLNDNILLQLISCLYTVLFLGTLVVQSISNGLNTSNMPLIGSSQSGTIGNVLFNFAMANEIPSWINVAHPRVSAHKSIWISISLAISFYILVGIFGALSFYTDSNINLLQAMYNRGTATPSASSGWLLFIYILFPIMTYATSIPIAMIVVKMNFLAAGLCTTGAATFWAVYMPFLVGIPFQTGNLSSLFGVWTSVTLQATCNFFVPFLIFLYMSRRNTNMAQSVIDELEFLDISAGIKKGYTNDDDEFDYIYHLPFADPDRIIPRDPFKKANESEKLQRGKSTGGISAVSGYSSKAARSMLDPNAGKRPGLRRNRNKDEGLMPMQASSVNVSHTSLAAPGGHLSLGIGAMGAGSRAGSIANMCTNNDSAAYSMCGSNIAASRVKGSMRVGVTGVSALRTARLYSHDRADPSMQSDTIPSSSTIQLAVLGDHADYQDIDMDMNGLLANGDIYISGFAPFRALPVWITRRVRSKQVALIGLVIMAAMIAQVISANLLSSAH
ncbi:hypothetical protein BASA50_007167 [Batrachochytrium salamandrivorans]|uniref:Amino acid transporter transmembrane domain-containing protein n=1 Tax=Batrachochytrium salamandrivorans TaxID=1357716 RepID=A0ABQ8F8C5_9FUNG|nr:hypothetical protein BASA60_009357 [Batrachochytrium salamandrivorans]KAH6589475.1 hypothetical protein BASA61_005606 [Batrachochytrium salamandrivorans]KAH6593731.1 hypothetical protein BASA50_007167 [Batrachochytrium salamandrivorans]KAH9265199.1 hypothetical protein BASA83_011282 [Batrachochytrium salamandrivorans]